MTSLNTEAQKAQDTAQTTPWRFVFIHEILPYLDLACAAVAAAAWFIAPELGILPLGIAFFPWAMRLLLEQPLTIVTRFAPPLTLFIVTAATSVWAAYDQQQAWAKFWVIIGGVLLFYAFANAYAPAKEPAAISRRHAWLLALFGGSLTLYFLATHNWEQQPGKITQLTLLGQALQSPLPVIPGGSLHPDMVGGILAMLLPFSIATRTRRNGATPQRRPILSSIASLLLAGLILFGLLMSSSRGAWLGLATTVGLFVYWHIARLLTRRHPRRRLYFWVALLLLVAAGLFVLFPGKLIERLSRAPATIDSEQPPEVLNLESLNRLDIMQASLILVMDYPFIGAGLDSFDMLYATYSHLLHVGSIDHSHNLFLDMTIYQGLLGLAAVLWSWLIVALAFLRLHNTDTTFLGAALLSVLIIAVHGLVDDALYGSRAVILLFVPLAFAVPALKVERFLLSNDRRLTLLLVGIAVLTILAFQRPLRSLAYSNLAAVEQSRTELSVYDWPEWPVQDELRRNLDMTSILAYYEQALALNPNNAAANRRLGQIELSLGEYEEALVHLQAAYERTPWDNATRQLLGEALIANGRVEEGAEMWATAARTNQQLTLRAFWYEHIGDTQRLEWVQAAIDH